MVDVLKIGDKVRSKREADLGLGKVVQGHSTLAVVYFKGIEKPTPEQRIKEYRLPTEALELVPDVADTELDNLPPYDNGKFKRTRTELTIEKARELFSKVYPRGFDDPLYHDMLRGERAYKVEAHRRFVTAMSAGLASLPERPAEIRAALWGIYHGSDTKVVPALNLMHPRWEAPAFFEALEDEAWAAEFLRTALSFSADPNTGTFAAYSSLLEKMPGKVASLTGKWPYLTWLPFVAAPDKHMMVRPSVTDGFASAAGFDIRYDAEANWQTYDRILVMSAKLLGDLERLGLTLSGRKLDMIDLQSFEWVVQRYFEPGALEAAG